MRIPFKPTLLMIAVAAVGGLAFTYSGSDKMSQAPRVSAPKAAVARLETAPAHVQPPAGPTLPERGGLPASKTPLFSTQSWEPPPPKVKPGPPPPPPKPVAPPLPYTFAGRMLQDGTVFVFLARGDTVITAKQGDIIDGVYRVDSITETQVALTYVPLGQKQSLAVVSSLPRALAPFGDGRPALSPPPRADSGAAPTSVR